jgi:hypothetical protein
MIKRKKQAPQVQNWFNLNPPKVQNIGSFMKPAQRPIFRIGAPAFLDKKPTLSALWIPQRMESNKWLPMVQTPRRPVGLFWGDRDNDGVYNGLDCQPDNSRMQGAVHRRKAKRKFIKPERPLLSDKFRKSVELKRYGRHATNYAGGIVDNRKTVIEPSKRFLYDKDMFEDAYKKLQAHEMIKEAHKDKDKRPSRNVYLKDRENFLKEIKLKDLEFIKGKEVAELKGAKEEINMFQEDTWGSKRGRGQPLYKPSVPGAKFRKTEDEIRKMATEWTPETKKELNAIKVMNNVKEDEEEKIKEIDDKTYKEIKEKYHEVKEENRIRNELDTEKQIEEREKRDKRVLDILRKDVNYSGEDEFSEEDLTDD